MLKVRPMKAFEGETVRIEWTLADGQGTYTQDVTIPPKPTRNVRRTNYTESKQSTEEAGRQ